MAEKRSSDDADQDSVARDAEMIAAARDKIVGDNQTLESPGNRAPRFSGPPADSFVGYKIIKEVHRGGQGVVYQALQKATKRKVAIKVLKEGPFSGQADRARFDREVQILGQLNHPNIVTIHDSGSSAGCQFFVMDYVRGQPLDVYMASRERSIDETLRLFGKICDAVNSAHLRGVIHRDLKPGNIVVDADGEPHVLDFGLAKVVVSETEASAMTLTGQFVGSLGWASPEQAEGVPSKIDVRTDVYSLGVILYQMLTSKFPYEVVGNLRDVLDRIMRSEPTRPGAIREQVNDELDTIVLKCLQKERERRYQTAGELARDIERYLAGEPIEAKRDSGWYMFKKTIHRYRVAAAVSASMVFVIVVGLAVTLVFWQQAVRQRDRAVAAERTAGEARSAAERARAAETEQRLLAEQHLRHLEEERERAEKAEKLAAQWLAELGQVQAEAQRALQSEIDSRQMAEQRPTAVATRQAMPGAASKPGQPLGFLDDVLAFAEQAVEPPGTPPPTVRRSSGSRDAGRKVPRPWSARRRRDAPARRRGDAPWRVGR